MKPNSTPLDRLKAQLAQVEGLISEGVLKGAAARKARDDLERQILALVVGPVGSPEAASPTAAAAPRPGRGLVAGVVLFVLVFGLGSYALLGNHAGWDVGPGETAEAADAGGGPAHAPDSAQIDAMIASLAERLKSHPEDADGWAMLGRSYTAQGRYAEALPAYKKAFALRPEDAQTLADYADGLAMVNNRSLDGEPERLVMKAVKLDPSNIKALALAGTVTFNHGDYKAAIGYWDRAVKASGPESELGRQLQGAIHEARQRAGLPELASADAQPASGAPDRPGAAAAGATVAGRLTLKPGLQAKVSPDDTVFIFARPAIGSRMPVAILRRKVSDLPMDFSLDDSMAMSPAASLSTTPTVVVGARISRTGNAMPAAGDWEVLSRPVPVGTRDLRLEIADPVR